MVDQQRAFHELATIIAGENAFAPNLRPDPAFKLACGRLPDSGRDLCTARAVYSRLLTPLVGLLGGVVLDFSDRVSGDNSFIESFNSKFGAEWLNTHTPVHDLDDARTKMEDWRRDYNEKSGHTARSAIRRRFRC